MRAPPAGVSVGVARVGVRGAGVRFVVTAGAVVGRSGTRGAGGVGVGVVGCGAGGVGLGASGGRTTPICRGPAGAAMMFTRYTGGRASGGGPARWASSTAPAITARCSAALIPNGPVRRKAAPPSRPVTSRTGCGPYGAVSGSATSPTSLTPLPRITASTCTTVP